MKTINQSVKFYSTQQGTNEIYLSKRTGCLQVASNSPNNVYIFISNQSNDNMQKVYLNLERIKMIKQLKNNWDGYGAKTFSVDLLDDIERIIRQLEVQPNLFPLSNGAIQLEMNRNGCAIEIEISEDKKALVNIVDENDNETTKEITNDFTSINEELNKFYVHEF